VKKKITTGIVIVIAAAVLIIAAVWVKNYYEDRYVGEDYYAVVPLGLEITLVPQKDMDGREIGVNGFDYSLTAYNEQGEARKAEFTVTGDDLSKYPQAGAFLKIKASKTLVVGWSFVKESEVPQKALEMLKNQG